MSDADIEVGGGDELEEVEGASFDLRRLPPVPPEEQPVVPGRISQTLAKRADVCPRSAYFYMRFGGGAPSKEMVRGTVTHMFAERMMVDLMREGERSLYAPQEADPDGSPADAAFHAEDRVRAAREVAATTATMVHEILAGDPSLTLPAAEVDDVREMAYHIAVGLDVNPEEVVAVETKFVLDLPSGWTISGKIDLATLPAHDVEMLGIDDYKTTLNFPTKEEWLRGWQPRFYGVLALFGNPVTREECSSCDGSGEWFIEAQTTGVPEQRAPCADCGGRGSVEVRLPSIGEHIQRIHARELYPRYLVESPGAAPVVKNTDALEPLILTRQHLLDFIGDIELAVARVQHGFETGDWPALPDPKWCTECAGRMVCPLPAHLRRFAGAINTPAEAAEAKAWSLTQGARVKATDAEFRSYVKAHGAVEMPTGDRYELVAKEGQKLKTGKGGRTDWEGLRDAIAGAVELGEPFDITEWIKTTTTTKLELIKGDIDGRRDDDLRGDGGRGDGPDAVAGEADRGERWGDDVPWE